MNKPADKFIKIVEWSDEDKCYIGRCPGLFFGGVHGDDEAAVYADLCVAVDDVLDGMKKRRSPVPRAPRRPKPSGKILVRITPELHEQLALKAIARGVSLNELCARTLSGEVIEPVELPEELQAKVELVGEAMGDYLAKKKPKKKAAGDVRAR